MADLIVPAPPVIVSAQRATSSGQSGVIISGTENLSDVPSGYSVVVNIYDSVSGHQKTQNPSTVNSDGTWQATVAATSGEAIYARAVLQNPAGDPTTNSPKGKTFVLP